MSVKSAFYLSMALALVSGIALCVIYILFFDALVHIAMIGGAFVVLWYAMGPLATAAVAGGTLAVNGVQSGLAATGRLFERASKRFHRAQVIAL
jgi:hypothetical protein